MPYGDSIIGEDVLVGDELLGDDDVSGGVLYAGADELIGADPDAVALMAGDDDYAGDELWAGAAPRRPTAFGRGRGGFNPRQRTALSQVMNRQMQADRFAARRRAFQMSHGQPALVRQISPDRKLKLPAGFSATGITTLASATITVRPQCLFRADELVIPETFANNFVITELSIGQIRLIVGSAPVPAAAFSEKSLRPLKLDWPTNQITQEILMQVTNIAATTQAIYGMFFGRAAV